MKLPFRILAIAALVTSASSAQQVTPAVREMFNVGVREFSAEQYRSAAESFQKVIVMAPNLLQARVYLATAYVQLYVPGKDTADNRENAKLAINALSDVLSRDPKNLTATDSMASLYFQMRDLPNATEWVHRVLSINPGNKGALTTLGLIAWLEFIDKDREARVTLEMQQTDPGPLPDDELRAELKAQYWERLEDGIASVKQAISDDAAYVDAMVALVQLLRAEADLTDTETQYQTLMSQANEWAKRAGGSPTGNTPKP